MSACTRITLAVVIAMVTALAGCEPPPEGSRGPDRFPGFPLPKLEVPKPLTGPPLFFPTGGGPTWQYPIVGQGSYQLYDKQCSACGRSVALTSRAGQRCPYCGAYWSAERAIYR